MKFSGFQKAKTSVNKRLLFYVNVAGILNLPICLTTQRKDSPFSLIAQEWRRFLPVFHMILQCNDVPDDLGSIDVLDAIDDLYNPSRINMLYVLDALDTLDDLDSPM